MKVKVSDYIADYLVSKGIVYNFTVPGGGAMHLNMSFGHKEGMHNIFVQHEQAAAMAAEGFYRIKGQLPLVCCTTGPGGTNTLTGVLGAWLDSIPMLVISGQVKYSTTVRSTGLPIRIFGDQEFDITRAVAPMTKYAEMIRIPEMVKYCLDKALFLATHGRPGPVWLDIPQDIQSAMIDPAEFVPFNEGRLRNTLPMSVSDQVLDLIVEKLKDAKRPVFYTGVEIRNHGAYGEFLDLARKLNIPVVTSFDGMDLLPEHDPLYAGRAGDVGNRYGNWAVQNSDFLLVIGSRLGIRQVSYATETWAREAFVVMVHEDPVELLKPAVHVELPVRADIRDFMRRLSERFEEAMPPKAEWVEKCASWKRDYPVVDIKRHYKSGGAVNPYHLMNELCRRVPEDTVIVSANGSACVVGGSAFLLKRGQRFILNSGCASMGYDLPAAIGACFASEKRETLCLAGDGSIQMNLQELQTIVFHKLPIKILVINNAGYHSMRQTQNNLFAGEAKVGIGPESGDLGFPDMGCIAAAYGIPFFSASTGEELDGVLDRFMAVQGYAMCQVYVDITQEFEPKPKARKLDDGTLISPPLEDMAPFLPREELRELMVIPLVGEK